MESMIAHDIVSVPRTEDVVLLENVSFKDMFFSDEIHKSLTDNGFIKPSPIQFKAIPLARCGFDLIVQSKSGTGKTLVFVISALESLDPSIKRVQTIVLTPTREIALQVTEVFQAVGSNMKDLKVHSFIGGTPLPKDISATHTCQIAVGAPGRIRQLIELGHLKTDAVRLFVLDEADQLLSKNFQNDINFIYWSLSEFKQTLALSATYPDELVKFLGNYMRCGKLVTPETDPTPVLKGLKQFVSLTRKHADALARLTDKENRLISLLTMVKFNQCLIFSNYKSRAESTCNMLRCRGWSCEWISGGQAQDQRLKALHELRSGRCRLLVTTDLTARGIDSKGINLVINMDTPFDPRIYLHRMGRAGRYGSQGVVITILSEGKDVDNFLQMLGLIDKNLPVKIIPSDGDDYDLWSDESTYFDELYGTEISSKSIERYKIMFASTEASSVELKKTDTKKSNKSRKEENVENSSIKNVSLPDLNEENFPSIPCKQNSLNEYFLHESVPCEFLSLSSLKESLNGFEIKNGGNECNNVNGNKENGNGGKTKSNKNISSKEKPEDKKSSLICEENKVELKTKLSVIHSTSNGPEVIKSVLKNVTNQPVRRFSYSDIAKGKRVECKPLGVRPDEVKHLKTSPLKSFPIEKVSNNIEGVNISAKAINGFSKRMYSSVLKGSKSKKDTKTSTHSLKNSSINSVEKSNSIQTENSHEKENSNKISDIQSQQVKPIAKSVLIFTAPKKSVRISSNVSLVKVVTDNIHNSSLPISSNNPEQCCKAENSKVSNSIIAQDRFKMASISDKKADLTKEPLKKFNRLNHSENFLDNSKNGLDSDSTDYSDFEGEYIITGSFSKDCSFSRAQQIKHRETDELRPRRMNLSKMNTSSHHINRSVTENSSQHMNLSSETYHINRSITENNKPFGFKEWFEMYYQQASLIHNYVKYYKEIKCNRGFYQ